MLFAWEEFTFMPSKTFTCFLKLLSPMWVWSFGLELLKTSFNLLHFQQHVSAPAEGGAGGENEPPRPGMGRLIKGSRRWLSRYRAPRPLLRTWAATARRGRYCAPGPLPRAWAVTQLPGGGARCVGSCFKGEGKRLTRSCGRDVVGPAEPSAAGVGEEEKGVERCSCPGGEAGVGR